MPTLTIRQLDQQTYLDLKAQAERNGRSMEAEVRDLIACSVQARNWVPRWIAATESLRGADLPIPPRSQPRAVDSDAWA